MAEFQKVAQVGDIAPNGVKAVQLGGAGVALVNLDGQYYALGNVCPHAHCSLSDGEVEEGSLVCPCHGSAFDVRTGEVTSPPAMTPVAVYPVRVQGNDILVSEPA